MSPRQPPTRLPPQESDFRRFANPRSYQLLQFSRLVLQRGLSSGYPAALNSSGFFLPQDANNLLAMLWIWQHGGISANELYGGDFRKVPGVIAARAYVILGQTDLYFPTEDSEIDVSHMPNARLIQIPSVCGHFAAGPGTNPGRCGLYRRDAEGTAGRLTRSVPRRRGLPLPGRTP